jgi:glycosyltransferase involved in cell wall biosynthesis
MNTRLPHRRLRVAHVTLGLEVGGQEKLLVEFARHADRERFSLHFVSLTGRGALTADIEACGWPVTALEAPQGVRPGLVGRLRRVFLRERIDVVHTHDDRPNIYGAPAARLAGVRRVLHTRHSQGTNLSWRQRQLVRLASLGNDRFVCVSQNGCRWAVRQGISRRRLAVLHNGIDVERISFSGPAPGGPAMLVARLAPEKDIPTLLRAAAMIARQRPDFRLEIAGGGALRGELESLRDGLGLAGVVRFLGEVREAAELLGRARLFVLSSVTEGVSLTLLEAMARGLPVVATAVGGNPEVVEAGATGLLVSPRDPVALAGAVLGLWGGEELGARLGNAGRRRVERHFDVRSMVARYEAMYGPTSGVNGA